ncbi:hypothetical protein OG874_00275 [Nocardia sp. NBC_00565]|uniref:hypothetical protein n=1 Tax=Nocardia sp. NBC_00565 TaxID=2975993 RepID=UPI002E80C6C8|nr:hypothetical protein [Nocardia sp. NBC_00565]WUC03690.1 hypothetical protein OG874_00275 [Nocardia sp. NBC_00565]
MADRDLIAEVEKLLSVQPSDHQAAYEWLRRNQRDFVAALEAAQRPPQMPGYPMALADFDGWLNHGDRGLSSNMIVAVITGVTDLPGKRVQASLHLPGDAGDFWRCENLLRAVPNAREHLDLVAAESPEWAALVEHWDELVTLDRDALTRRIKALIREVKP